MGKRSDIPHGYCQCGCGNKTPLLKCTSRRRGHISGEPAKFKAGHAQKLKMKACSVDGCTRRAKARGLCNLHYMRKWHFGDVFKDKPAAVKKDITGNKYGRWFVIKESHTDTHGSSYWDCICDCGTERIVRGSALWKGTSLSCGCIHAEMLRSNTGEKSSGWKGGRRICNGYVFLKKRGHSNTDKDGYIPEHRFVMSEYLQRPLQDYEIVHHKNKIRTDNRLENLELLTNETHYGHIVCPYCKGKFIVK